MDVDKLRLHLQDLPEPIVKPALILVSGLPGTGKSFFSRKLSERLPSVILESDTLRKILFPSPSYTPRENNRLFTAIHSLVKELLKSGITVILDATNLIERNRENLYRIADNVQAKLIIVKVEAPTDVVQQRLLERSINADSNESSDADWQIYEMMKPKTQKIHRNYFRLDTSKDINPVINKIIRETKR